jgi:hypothetical protein
MYISEPRKVAMNDNDNFDPDIVAGAHETIEARELATKLLDRALKSFCERMSKKHPEGRMAYGITGLKLALMQMALQLQLMLEHTDQATANPQVIAETLFVESARLAFREFVETHEVYAKDGTLIRRNLNDAQP